MLRVEDIEEKQKVARRTAYHHGDLRHQLVQATRQLVEEKGPDRFSVSEACRAAGVSTAAPYRHFSDKQDMLMAVALDGMLRMSEQMSAASAPHDEGSIERVVASGIVYVDFAVREPGVFRLMFGLTEEHDDNPEIKAAGAQCHGLLLRDVAAYLRKPGVDEEVLNLSFPLWTMVHGTSFLLIDRKVKVMDLEPDIPSMIRRSTERLLGPRPADG
ncbi:MAG: TetR/AcrR family transcriptional regulator [Pseudomonadota bacterium]